MSQSIPVVAIRGGVVFLPNGVVHTLVGRPQSIAALDAAVKEFDSKFLFLTQCNEIPNPGVSDLYQVGTVARVVSTSWINEEQTQFQMLAETSDRVRVLDIDVTGAYFKAQIDSMPYENIDMSVASSLLIRLKAGFARYYENDSSLEMRLVVFEKIKDYELLANKLAFGHLQSLPVAEQQSFLEQVSVLEKLKILIAFFETKSPATAE